MTIDTTAARAAREDDLKTSAANTVLAIEDLFESALPDSVKTSVLNQLRELTEKANLTGFIDPGTLASRPILELGAGPATVAAPTSNPEADAALAMLTGLASDLSRTPAQLMSDLPNMFQQVIALASTDAVAAQARLVAARGVLDGGYSVKNDGTIDLGANPADLATAKTERQQAIDALDTERDDSRPTTLAGKLKKATADLTEANDKTKAGSLAHQLEQANAAVTSAKQTVVDAVKPALQIVKDAPEVRIGEGRKVKIDDAVLKTATDAVGL